MLLLQENTQSRYETLSSAVIDLYALTNNRLEENKLALDNISQVNYKILEQNDEQMATLNKNIYDIGNSIGSKIDHGNELLFEISSFQKNQLDKSIDIYNDILNNLMSIHRSIENSSTNQSTGMSKLADYQLKTLETVENAIDSFKQGQEVLINLQKQGTEKNIQNSSSLLVSIKEANSVLEENKRSIKSLLKLQESAQSKEAGFQSTAITLLESMNSGIYAGKEINRSIQEDAKVLNTERSNAIEEGLKSINSLIGQLSSMKKELNASSERLDSHTAMLRNVENKISNGTVNSGISTSKEGKRKGIFSYFTDKL
jgi:hypothetical protein